MIVLIVRPASLNVSMLPSEACLLRLRSGGGKREDAGREK
jgi:hypothetical protein